MASKTNIDDPVYKAGVAQGYDQLRSEVLTFLEKKYMHPSVHRGTPIGTAILEVTSDLSAFLKTKIEG